MALVRSCALALAFLVTAGCGGGGGGGDGGGLSDSAEGRRRMPSCGSYTATEREPSAEEKAVRDCFLAVARDGTQMEATVTTSTIEGDAIVTIFRVLGPGDIELFVDASADTFSGPVKMFHQRCTGVVEEGNGLVGTGCVTLA